MTQEAEPTELRALNIGHRVKVHDKGRSPYEALIEDFMPGRAVVWIRDLETGERRLLLTDESRLTRIG